MPSAPPKVVSAEVVAAQPTDADRPLLASLSREVDRRLPASAFIVKIELQEVPEPTGDGWALYVGSTRIPKYWEYPGGIYFKVLDESFLTEHRGEPIRFSHDDQKFVNTGVTLPGPERPTPGAKKGTRKLPAQAEILGAPAPARARTVRKGGGRTKAKQPRPARKRTSSKTR